MLTILVAVEVVAEPLLAKLLPINAIRNLAILASSTPLVAMIDVDLLLSASLAGELVDSQERCVAVHQLYWSSPAASSDLQGAFFCRAYQCDLVS